MDTLLVTGGAGFIGANFVRRALETTPYRVVVLDKLTYAGHRESLAELERDPRFAFVQADVVDGDAVRSAFAAHRPAVVVHLAAETHVDRSLEDPTAFVRTNVHGTIEMLEAARAHVASLDPAAAARFRLVHVSTDEVYGSLGETGAFTETSPFSPRSPYSASKAAADRIAVSYHRTFGLPVVVTHGSNTYGRFQFVEKLIPLMTLNAAEGKPLPVYGDGKNVRDWLHVDDHADGILAAASKGRPGERYNLGGGTERTNLDVVGAICRGLEASRPAARNPALASRGIGRYADLVTFVEDRPGHDRRYAVDASKAKGALGWSPRRPFDDGIAATVRWYMENDAWRRAVEAKGYRRERLGLAAKGGAR